MTDTACYIQKLSLSDLLREPVIRKAIKALKLPPGSRGLDAGCGIGSHTLLLAERVGSDGHVTGLDLSPEFLQYAEKSVRKSILSERISFQPGNVNKLPFEDDSFDWVWSVDCVGYPVAESRSPLTELVRVVKPGGKVAILGWSSQQLLPGFPLLEAGLNATCSVIEPYVKDKNPESNFMRTLGWFHQAGLKEPTVQTFVGSVHAPLSNDIRNALISLFQMLWVEPGSKLAQGDWKAYKRLCEPESPDFILNLSAYYAFFTYSMFQAKVT